MARPRIHDRHAVTQAVCKRITAGAFVKDACAAEGITPDQIRDYCATDETLSALYARARQQQAHAIAEDALIIADGNDLDAQRRLRAMVKAVENVDDDDKDRILNALANSAVQRDRIRVDARKWMASKIAPRLYGERLTLDGDPERPVQVQHTWKFGDKTVTF